MDSKIRHIRMVGIGRAGMSGIAEVLLNLGYDISGFGHERFGRGRTSRACLGARIAVGHAAENVGNVQVLVTVHGHCRATTPEDGGSAPPQHRHHPPCRDAGRT